VSAVAASGLAASPAVAAAVTPQRDGELLRRALDAEYLVVIAYRRALGSGKLEPQLAAWVGAILRQELAHVTALKAALAAAGVAPPSPPSKLLEAQRRLADRHVYTPLGDLRSRNECLKLLIDVESMAEAEYFNAIGKLHDPALVRLSARIMGSEAQHWTALSAARHHGDVMLAVPYPFVQGTT
jgi:hypothetical protein